MGPETGKPDLAHPYAPTDPSEHPDPEAWYSSGVGDVQKAVDNA